MPASLSPMKREQLGRMKGPKTLTGSKSSVKAKRLPKKFQKKFLKKVMKVLGKVETRSRSKLITDYMVPKKHHNKKRSESSKIADKFSKEIDTAWVKYLLPAFGHGTAATTGSTTTSNGGNTTSNGGNAAAFCHASRFGHDTLHCLSSTTDRIRSGTAWAWQNWRMRSMLGSSGWVGRGDPQDGNESMHTSCRGTSMCLCGKLDCCEYEI